MASRTPKRRVGSANAPGFYWILAAVCLGVLGWVWWEYSRSPATPPVPPARVTNVPPAPRPIAPSPVPAPPRPTVVVPPVPVPPKTQVTPVPPTPPLPPTNGLVEVRSAPTNRPASNPPPVVVAAATNGLPSKAPSGPRYALEVLEAQVALSRRGISCGSLDGVIGSQTRAALRAFQRSENLPVTGEWDPATKARLPLPGALFTNYSVTAADCARLHPVPRTWLGKSQQDRLDYESLLELVAERGHAHPELLRRLNPELGWTNLTAGSTVKIPLADYPPPRRKAARVRISLSGRTLEAHDSVSNLLVHFPCSIGRRMESRPVGELHVIVLAPNPNYTFNPAVFPESAEGQQLGRKLTLPAGPNNPVGTAWIGLDRSGYGIHGTPHPEQVGRTESHGCFRLANWNAEYLLQLVELGTPVVVEP